jgi:hypothetical protein
MLISRMILSSVRSQKKVSRAQDKNTYQKQFKSGLSGKFFCGISKTKNRVKKNNFFPARKNAGRYILIISDLKRVSK